MITVTEVTCYSCNQLCTVRTITPKAKPYTRVITKSCGCGYHVQVVALLDPDKFASHDPLPGYDREAISQRLSSFQIVLGQDSGFRG